ncbi:hypothetical protein [Pseudomonas capsici]|uniref:hypothetical protein n=1 Tax=Pseudomonas capsici TaxID=2810614 RepID=UPI0021F0EC12|nr:hypothetical protein [Pseudomonas capsici]MCV4264495.1 hypothetical protein [Pseudomonas capsici]
MAINFDVVIETPDYEVDMKAGLDTLQGISDATRTIAETLLTAKVPQRKNSKSNVRTMLKKSFKGSYGQIFSLDISDEELKKEYRKIGNSTFSELMEFFMKEALDLEVNELSEKAENVVANLGDNAERLVRQLRTSIMRNAHEVSKKFGYDVKVSFRKSSTEKVLVARFDQTTALALEAERSNARETIFAAVRRFNTNTGNGRLQINGGDETIAFGFERVYKDVRFATKKKFSENLDHNNGINIEKWRYLEIEVYPIKLFDGRVIKYVVAGIHEDE